MGARTLLRLGGWAVAVAAAAGCTSTTGGRGLFNSSPAPVTTGGKFGPATTDFSPKSNASAPAGPLAPPGGPPGGVVQAGGQTTPPPVSSLPPPGPTPPPAALPGGPVTIAPAPGAAIDPYGPHVRTDPSISGRILGLGPGEIPMDRVLELSKRVDAVVAQNTFLTTQIQGLEAYAKLREQALAESIRGEETATADAARARGELTVARADATAARTRLDQVEQEDIDTLRSLITVLERLVSPPARREP
ncbi:MAG TPA: hypothetical protein VH092_18975 [Urbifossiella sp.]|nr:hypothetical protein [Urbifossiella sp.]